MASNEQPTLSQYVNEAGAYVLSISAIPAEHLHRPLVVRVSDDTVVDETTPSPDLGWCGWCEEAQSPAYLRHEGHDPQCPLDPALWRVRRSAKPA